MNPFWEGIINPPLAEHPSKPRSSGISMILDKGLSLAETRALLETSAAFIDFIKLSFGTIALYDPYTLTCKIELAHEYGTFVYPGGTFLEIAVWQERFEPCLQKLTALKMNWVEISDGTIELPHEKRVALIQRAKDHGFSVITEVGKKNPAAQPDDDCLIRTAQSDLDNGADWIIIEARESGKNIGVYDRQGDIIEEKLTKLRRELPLSRIIWEAPLKSQQADLINRFGPNVSLGNIPPSDAMALEALREGFRSDTWHPVKTFYDA